MQRIFNHDLLISFLSITLIILILIIIYRWFIRFLSRKKINPEDYCTLYDVEFNVASGEIAFYFTTKQTKAVKIFLKDAEGKEYQVVEKEFEEGGHICRYNSSNLPNGDYFYVLKTKNQEISKRIEIKN